MSWDDWIRDRRVLVSAGAAAVVVAAAGAAGGISLAQGDSGSAGSETYRGCNQRDANYDAMYPDFPVESAQDWLSFGDHVAVFHVRAGSEKRAGQERSVLIVVEQMLHSREGAKKLPKTFRAEAWEVPCAAWLKGGHSYLGVLVHDSVRKEPAAWRAVQGRGVLPYENEHLGTGEIEGRTGRMPAGELSPFGLSKQMNGEHALSLQSLLQQTEAYSLALRNPQLTPGERWSLVSKFLAERNGW